MTSGQEREIEFLGDHPLLARGRRDWLLPRIELDDCASECDIAIAFGDSGIPLSGQPTQHPEIPDRSAKR